MPLTPKGMIRLLLQNGFVYVKSNNGSHQKYFNPQQKGLEQAILKQAGLKR